MNGLLVYWSADLVRTRGKEGKVAWRTSLFALVRFLIYGLALVFTTLTAWLDFYSAAGGLVLPAFTMWVFEGFKKSRSGGSRD